MIITLERVLNEIAKNHMMVKGKRIKYVDIGWDARTASVYNIRLRGMGAETTFHTGERDADGNINRTSLPERVMEFLQSDNELTDNIW